ncbi:MAG: PEP-CTERM sorting domain-containing protein [Verrucomicrobiota bacterium]
MKSLSSRLFVLALACCEAPAGAATTTVSFSPGLAIPDNSTVGVADIQMISSNITDIRSVEISLTITGGFNGDYYVYLEHGGSHTILMNRAGLTPTENLGYAGSGVNVIFTADAVNGDIHLYQRQPAGQPAGTGPLTGLWQPDGRDVNPLVAFDNVPRSSLLNAFNGQDASGLWTLFAADRSSGALGTFSGWSLTITGEAVPEPGSAITALLGGFLALRGGRRR